MWILEISAVLFSYSSKSIPIEPIDFFLSKALYPIHHTYVGVRDSVLRARSLGTPRTYNELSQIEIPILTQLSCFSIQNRWLHRAQDTRGPCRC